MTSVCNRITETIRLLQENGKIDPSLTLREAYNKYLSPDNLPIDDPEIWKQVQENKILSLFQMDSQVGSQGVKKVQPSSIESLSDTNGLIRLMTAEGETESPMDRYVRMKKDISQWYAEMDRYGLKKEEQKILEPHFLPANGTPISQEQMMEMLMDKDICGFTLGEANAARKIVGES